MESEITQLIAQFRQGDEQALQRLVKSTYAELRKLAHSQLASGRDAATLDTTGLVHEWYLRLVDHKVGAPNDRRHFFALAAKIMRQVICQYARERLTLKRGEGERPLPIDEVEHIKIRHAEQFVDVDDALSDLTKRDPRLAQVVECRFFAGLTSDETAEAMATSTRTVERLWTEARTWLEHALRA